MLVIASKNGLLAVQALRNTSNKQVVFVSFLQIVTLAMRGSSAKIVDPDNTIQKLALVFNSAPLNKTVIVSAVLAFPVMALTKSPYMEELNLTVE